MNSRTWHSTMDVPIRLMILRKTFETFQKVQLPCDPDVFRRTLEEIVPRLELALYNTAASIEEYGNPRTVEQRLERIAPSHVQLKPLEALWLQGLFAATSSQPSTTVSGGIESGSSVTEGTTFFPSNQQASLPSLTGTQPSETQTQEQLTMIPVVGGMPGTSGASIQHPDQFTRSLIELYQFLTEYDQAANIVAPSEFLLQGIADTHRPLSSPSANAPDLMCHERIEDIVGNGNEHS